jgi:hypothetical protein
MVYGTIGRIGGVMQRGSDLLGAARKGFNHWSMRNPILGFGALGLGIGAFGLGYMSPKGTLTGGAIGAGAGLAGVAGINYMANYMGRGLGGSQTLMSGGKAAAKKFGLIGAGAGALIGAAMSSNRGVNRFSGF